MTEKTPSELKKEAIEAEKAKVKPNPELKPEP